MASRFIFTEEAETQLLEILDHLADESEAAAVRVRHALYDAAGKLAERPGIGHTRPDLTDRQLKFWSVYSYLVVYDARAARSRSLRCSTAPGTSRAAKA